MPYSQGCSSVNELRFCITYCLGSKSTHTFTFLDRVLDVFPGRRSFDFDVL